MTGPNTPWGVAVSSVRGSAHVRTGSPNQDAFAVVEEPGGLVVAIADGHGGRAYVRSGVGARLAVAVASSLGRVALAAASSPEGLVASVRTHLADRIVGDWRQAVDDHAATHPWTLPEDGRRESADTYEAYGCTLLAAVAVSGQVVLVRLGDGDLIAVDPSGRVLDPLPADPAFVAGATASLCQRDADQHLHVALVRDPRLVVLATDGYGVAFASPRWRELVADDLQTVVTDRGIGAVQTHLTRWLADSADVGGDDVTVAVLAPSPAALPDQEKEYTR